MLKNLFGEDPIERSIDILKEFEPKSGYFLAFSGGKDSIVLYNVAKLAGVKFRAYYSPTTIYPPELVRFIKKEYPDVEWTRPPRIRNFFTGIEINGLPTIIKRWCCSEFKEYAGRGKRVIIGIRAAESDKRARYPIVSFDSNNRKWRILPIHHWSDNDVWEYIKEEGIKYPLLYDEGFSRLGCILCPFQSEDEKIKSMNRWPAYFKRARKAAITFMVRHGKSESDGENYWKQWLKRKVPVVTTCQLLLFAP